ncbi:MAG: hypothetical protein IJT95_01340 [Abditibacteriota bacterium]|nr:hypothetical protein [Abditibacteriota bacterium]
MKILLLTAIFLMAAAVWAAPVRTTEFLLDFEMCPATEAFGSSREGMDVSYAGPGSLHRVIDTSSGKVLLARRTDLRYWGLNYTGRVFYFSADIMPGDKYGDAEFRYAFTSHWSQMGRPGRPEETVFSVRADRDGEPSLYNYKDEKVCSLEKNALSSIEAAFDYGSYHYTLTVNGEPVGGPNEFDDDLYQVTGLNIYVTSQTEGSCMIIDNLRAETLRSAPLPQRNSFQKPGPMPRVTLPAEKDTEDAVFVNDTC